MEHEENFGGEWFDTATGDNISLNEIEKIVKQYHPGVVFDRVPERAGDVRETKANTAPLKELGWKAERDLDDMMTDVWCWQQSNPIGYT